METICVCGHIKDLHLAAKTSPCLICRDCVSWQPEKSEPEKMETDLRLPPQQEAKRRTPEVVLREIRKFSLEQAVKTMPYVHPGVSAVDVAATFEDYIRNGKVDK